MGVLRVAFDAASELKLERIHFEGADEIEASLPGTNEARDRVGPMRITVSCVWSADSLVSERMTRVEDLVTVAPEDTIDEADMRARAAHVHHLPVLRMGALVGEICGCDLRAAPARDAVARHMRRDVFAISIGATLTEAAGAMSRLGIGSLFVFSGPKLAGILTRSDLRRVGAPDEAIDGARCVACGSGHGVRPDSLHDGLSYCPDCSDAYSPILDARNFGEGD
jgi:predicted transcriptional regulator